MTRGASIVSILVIAAAGLAVYGLTKDSGPQRATTADEQTSGATDANDVARDAGQYAPALSTEPESDTAAGTRGKAEDCIRPSQLASDPVLAAEYARLDGVITSGPTIAAYRGLSAAQLGELAIQGDSAAMAVLGAVAVMRASRMPDDRAVPYLLREEPGRDTTGFARPLEPDVARQLEEAREWFYRSALHGRLLALRNAGEVVGMLADSPAALGWIDEDEYESLSPGEKILLQPATVYEALAFRIAPELQSGPIGEANAGMTMGGEGQQAVLDELASMFEADRQAAGLPPIAIAESAAPSLQEFEAGLCEPFIDALR